jgi:hypothetical protein
MHASKGDCGRSIGRGIGGGDWDAVEAGMGGDKGWGIPRVFDLDKPSSLISGGYHRHYSFYFL